MSEIKEDLRKIKATIEVDGILHSRSLAEDVTISSSNLNYEFETQAERFAWWVTLSEMAQSQVDDIKHRLSVMSAIIDNEERIRARELKQQGADIKLTEKMVEVAIQVNGNYQRLELELLAAKRQLGLLNAGKLAMMQKKDMLISLGANFRAEGVSNPVILQDAIKERNRRAREQQMEEPETASKYSIVKKKGVRIKNGG